MRIPRSTLVVAAALLVIVAGGTWLRMLPFVADPAGTFLSDAAFHERMTMTSAVGPIPVRDLLANAPEGRVLGDLLPLAFYSMVAFVHRVLAALDHADIRFHSLFAIALFGGLIALPVFAMCRITTRDDRAGLLAALTAVVVPAHLHRTWCYWFRYESLGTLILAVHVAFGVAALAATDRRARWIHAAAAGLALWLALAVWRVSFMLPLLEAGFVMLIALRRPPSEGVRAWFACVIAGGTVACLTLGYLRTQWFVLSAPWAIAMALAILLLTPLVVSARMRTRFAGIAVAVLAGVGLSLVAAHDRQYGSVAQAALQRVIAVLGRTPSGDPMTALALSVDELSSSSPADLFGPGGLSWLGGGSLIALAALWLAAGRPGLRRLAHAPDGALLIGFLTAALAAITLVFVRNKVLLAPLFAVAAGLIAHGLLRARATADTPRRGARKDRGASSRSGARPSGLAIAGLAVLTLALVGATFDAFRLATSRRARLEPGLSAALDYIRALTPLDAIVLSTWERGYEIQALAGRRTVVDGLLEDPVVRDRIPRIAAALLQPRADSLAALCDQTGARYVLLPTSQWMLGILLTVPIGMRAELSTITAKVAGSQPLTSAEADHILVRMMVLGEAPPPFEKVFEQDAWRVYRLPEREQR
jgi:hypothetical protein